LPARAVEIAGLSRLASPKQLREIRDGLASGRIDIVVGTHRLLSKDITFRNLGLLIVDEEHRFGVAHKERLKQLRKLVDVLTLSATPIPRTLQMAYSGACAICR
jgi:transcription-repair coupling factor (superfamily II helicase)